MEKFIKRPYDTGDKMNNNRIKIAIPTTGRLAQESLKWLAELGVVDKPWTKQIVEAISKVKKLDTETYAKEALREEWNSGLEGLTLKYDLRSGWRLAFSAKDANLGGIPVTIYGSEPPTINGIRQGLGEIAIIGYDDLVAAMIPYIDPSEDVSLWGDLNAAIKPNSTDVRIIGSTGLNDYAGLFLMAGKDMEVERDTYMLAVRSGKIPVFVKGRYQGLLYYLVGDKVDARATEDVEKATKDGRCFGFDLVRSGNTIQKEQMKLMGRPRLYTRSVIVIDEAKFKQDGNLRDVVSAFKPWDGTEDYQEDIVPWELKLEQRLGDLWVK